MRGNSPRKSSRCTWWTIATRGFRSQSGVRKVMPLITSSTTSASRPIPRSTASKARGKTVARLPMRWTTSRGPKRSTRFAPG